MKRVKRERKAKKPRHTTKQIKRKLYVQKTRRKPQQQTFVQKELFEQKPAAEKEKIPKKTNLWFYLSVILIIILVLFLIRIIPNLKITKETKKSDSVVSSATAVVTQQAMQEKAVTEKKEPTIIRKQIKVEIYFPSNKWEVRDLLVREKDKLNTLIDELLKDKTQQGLFVYGYADRTGLRSYNLVVSEKRARNIAEFLSEKTGIGIDKIVMQGKGEVLEGVDGISNPLFRKVEIIKK